MTIEYRNPKSPNEEVGIIDGAKSRHRCSFVTGFVSGAAKGERKGRCKEVHKLEADAIVRTSPLSGML